MTTKEVVESLRVCSNIKIGCSGCALLEERSSGCLTKLLGEALPHIEALVAERDAAIADIKRAWLCATCKKREEGHEWLHCKNKRFAEQPDKTLTCDNFEWRGVMNHE